MDYREKISCIFSGVKSYSRNNLITLRFCPLNEKQGITKLKKYIYMKSLPNRKFNVILKN